MGGVGVRRAGMGRGGGGRGGEGGVVGGESGGLRVHGIGCGMGRFT